jgi:uncharacterized cupin superfamily protein
MDARPNALDPQWDMEGDNGPFRWRRARVGRMAGSRSLGASVFELEPGCSTFPLHCHYANEELLVVLRGRPTLRGASAERELDEGEVVSFPVGREGAHRIDNRSDSPVRVMIVSTMIGPDVVEHLDSEKVFARSYPPGTDAPDDAVEVMVKREDSRPFFEGEV